MKHFSNQPLDQLEPSYLEQYGLHKAPFSQEIDDKFLFLDADRVQRLNMLHHLTQYSDLLLIVTGDEGVGKTSLLHRFEIMADEDWQICNIEANALMDSDQLLRYIFNGFGFKSQLSTSSDIQQLFIEELSELKLNGVIPILVVDDAHELPIETLETIFQLADTELNAQRLLRIILFSDPSIDATLKSSTISHLRERVTHSMELAPFNEEQTEQYIYNRLTVAGLTGSNPIDHKILRRIYRGSDGYPNQINKLTHIALQEGIENSNNDALFSELNYHFPTRKYLISGSIAAIIIGIVLTIQDSINELFEDSEKIVLSLPAENRIAENNIKEAIKPDISEPNKTPESKQIPIKLNDDQVVVITEIPKTVVPVEPVLNTEPPGNLEERIILLDKELNTSTENLLDSTVVTTNTDTIQKKKTTSPKETKPAIISPEIKEIIPQRISASEKPQQVSLIGKGFSERSYVTVDWSGNSKRLSSQQVKIVNDKLIEISLTTGLKPEKWSVSVTHPKNGKSNTKSFQVIKTKQQKQTSLLTNINDEKWILAQNKKLYTLQLLGAKNKDDITNFANKKKLKGQYAMFTSVRNGEMWYHLIYGSYKDKLTALNTIKAIPKKIGIGKPWIRPFIDVQNAIKRQQENKAVTKIDSSIEKVNIIKSSTSLPKSVKEQSSWLWGQSPTNYTLQLLGTRNESSVKKFVLENNLQGKAIYFNVKRQGKDWFALVYGVYPDKNSALKARSSLSKTLQKAKPWPRNFASIHAELDKNP
ncbi:MAG: SPOR domain-containing protein [Thiohalomonadales bacterium]